PFITEEIWQRMAPLAGISGETIMRQPYPAPDAVMLDADATSEIEWVKAFIVGVRKIRSGMDIDPRKLLPVLLQGGSNTDRERLQRNRHYLQSVGRIEDVTWLDGGESAPESATELVGNMKLLIPLAGLIDKDAESSRLKREIEKKTVALERCEQKLANPKFVDKAPAAVVDKERAKADELRSAITSLQEQLRRIQTL
ncbi:MAG: valine--tRNA ligase, partial [Gammaproteobacteria bacterium]